MKTTTRTKTTEKNLEDYSKEELIGLLTNIEQQYNSKTERLKHIIAKLAQARIRIKTQKKSLEHLRKRIVELTPTNKSLF